MNITKVHYDPAAALPVKAKKKLNAGTFVVPAGDIAGRAPIVDAAAADAQALGVIAHDVEKDDHVACYRAGHVLDVTAGGTIAPGDKISTAADGKAVKAGAGPVVAIALSKGTNGKPVTVALV